MGRIVLSVLFLTAIAVAPSSAEARSHRRHQCCCGTTVAAAPQMTAVQSTAPQAVANNGQYQSFSFEPGATAAPVAVAGPTMSYAPVTQRYVPAYLRGGYKALGHYDR